MVFHNGPRNYSKVSGFFLLVNKSLVLFSTLGFTFGRSVGYFLDQILYFIYLKPREDTMHVKIYVKNSHLGLEWESPDTTDDCIFLHDVA